VVAAQRCHKIASSPPPPPTTFLHKSGIVHGVRRVGSRFEEEHTEKTTKGARVLVPSAPSSPFLSFHAYNTSLSFKSVVHFLSGRIVEEEKETQEEKNKTLNIYVFKP
tara:strand:- start:154 stop:477 length:324 start_codon:yes stop_codon:yes gene_type:complete